MVLFGKPLTLVLNLPVSAFGNSFSQLVPGHYPIVLHLGLFIQVPVELFVGVFSNRAILTNQFNSRVHC